MIRALAALALAGCFSATPPQGYLCAPDLTCPSGQQCVEGRCQTGGPPVADAAPTGDGGPCPAGTWCLVHQGGEDLHGVFVVGADAWAVGNNGTILHSTGGEWAPDPETEAALALYKQGADLEGITGTAGHDFWVAGASQKMLHETPGGWIVETASETFHAVATDSVDVAAVTDADLFAVRTGGTWTARPMATSMGTLRAVLIANNTVYAAGDSHAGRHAVISGSGAEGNSPEKLHTIWTDGTSIYVAGDHGYLASFPTTVSVTLTQLAAPGLEGQTINAIAGPDTTRLWSVTGQGHILSGSAGGAWTTERDTGVPMYALAIAYGPTPLGGIAVGAGGTIYRCVF